MQVRTGVDIVYLPAFERLAQNPAARKRVFHPSELARDKNEHLAGVFAIKESFFKALGKNPRFLDIEVVRGKGKPSVMYPSRYGIRSLDVSVSHEKDYCIASVVLMMDEKTTREEKR